MYNVERRQTIVQLPDWLRSTKINLVKAKNFLEIQNSFEENGLIFFSFFLSAISSRFYRFVFSFLRCYPQIAKCVLYQPLVTLRIYPTVTRCHVVALSRCHIVTMSHCHAVTLPRCHIVTLSWNSCEQCFLELMVNLDLIVIIVHIEIALMDWKSFQSC